MELLKLIKKGFLYWWRVTQQSFMDFDYSGKTFGEKIVIFWINFPLTLLLIIGIIVLIATIIK